MSVELSQQPRLLRIETSTDIAFTLRRIEAVEAISRPYVVQAEVLSTRDDVAAKDMIGQTALVVITRDSDLQPRTFHGVINTFRKIGRFGAGYTTYGFEIVPSFWNLTRTSDVRVFQNQSVPAIVKALCGEAAAAVPVFMSAQDTPRPYCMQYNETDFDFCQRLMDETGCGYYFIHGENEHTMLVASATADYLPTGSGPYRITSTSTAWDSLTGFSQRTRLKPGAVRSLDYDLAKHSVLLDATTPTVLQEVHNDPAFQMFHWPGGQHTQADAQPALLAMQTYEAEADLAQATGYDPAFIAGCKITVDLGDDTQATYLLTRVVHSAFDETQIVDGGGSGYSCAVTLMPDDRTYRPRSPRPRPVVPGLQSAIVVGKDGEEIYTDKLGRVKVRFLWDRKWPKNETACEIWVRVAQPAAGKWGGTFFLPRIGDEVLVGFVDGDPDKPVIVGSLYSDDAPLSESFPMPGNKERSGFHTRSSKGGGPKNANILYVDDTKSSEDFVIQAEKDMNVLIKNARNETINEGKYDGADTYLLRKGHKYVTLGKGDFLTHLEGGNHYRVIDKGNDALFVKKGDRLVVVNEGDYVVSVEKSDHYTEVQKGHHDLVVGQGNQSAEVNGNITQTSKTGNITIEAKAGKITLKAPQAIDLVCGGSSIKMTPFQIELKSMMIKNDAQMIFEAKSGLLAKVEGLMTNTEGKAIHIVKGGLVLIN